MSKQSEIGIIRMVYTVQDELVKREDLGFQSKNSNIQAENDSLLKAKNTIKIHMYIRLNFITTIVRRADSSSFTPM